MLRERLLDFGFTRDEAEVYVFLSKMGPCPARIVARRFDINRMKAYRILKALEERDLVDRIIGRPVKFVATPLKGTLKRYIEEMKVKISVLEKSEKEIIENWEKISSRIEASLEEPRFRIFQGRQQIYDLLVQMCGRAKTEVRIVTTINDLSRLSLLSIDDKLKALAHDGTRIRVLTQIKEHEFEEVENYIDFVEARHIILPAPIRFAIIDENETLTTVAMDDSMSMTTQEDTGLWTNASSYVTVMKVFFDALWRLAPEAQEIVEAMKTGRVPQELRIIRTQEDYNEIFREMIKQSKSEVDIMVNRIQDLPITIQDLQAALERNTKIRILTQIDLGSLPEINSISELALVMHNSTSTELLLLITDGRELLLNIPYWETMGLAVWSNLKAYVDTMIQVFEDYWKDGNPSQEIISKLTTQQVLLETSKRIKNAFDQTGWFVEVPGNMVGRSSVNHFFRLVAKNPDRPDKPLGLDLLIEGEAIGQIIKLSAKKMDLKPAIIVLASTKPFEKEEAKLAELYGIKLIYASDTKKLATKISDEANKSVKN